MSPLEWDRCVAVPYTLATTILWIQALVADPGSSPRDSAKGYLTFPPIATTATAWDFGDAAARGSRMHANDPEEWK